MRDADDRRRRGGARYAVLLACGALAFGLALFGAASAQAQDAAVKVLVFHGPPDETTDAGVAALEELAERRTTSPSTRRPTRRTSPATSSPATARLVFLNTAGDLLDAEQEGAVEAFIEDGGGFLGIGSTAQSEPGAEFFDGLIGARPTPDSSTDPSEQTVVAGDRVHPSHDATCRSSEPHRRLVRVGAAPDRQGAHASRATTRPTRRPATAPTSAAPTRRSPGAATTPAAAPSTPAWAARRRASARTASATTCRRAAVDGRPRARQLQGDDQQQLQGHEDHQRRPRRAPASPRSASRTASAIAPNGWVLYIGRGDCRTDAERGALARAAGARRASSTTPTRTSASAAAASTSTTRRRTTARSTAASRARARSPSTATAARAASAPTRTTTRWSTACSASRSRRTSTRPATSTCSTSRASIPASKPRGPAARAAHLEDVAAAHLALHDRPRHEAARPRLRGRGSSSTTPRSTAAATSAAAWASTPRATST